MVTGKTNFKNNIKLSSELLRSYEIESINHEEKTIILRKEGQKYFCKILKIDRTNQTTTMKVNGSLLELKIEKEVEKMLEKIGIDSSSSTIINELIAPMPGLIIAIPVDVGQKINKDDPLVILEAMKMENILTSPVDGIIESINVTVQQTVEKNSVLIKFEE